MLNFFINRFVFVVVWFKQLLSHLLNRFTRQLLEKVPHFWIDGLLAAVQVM